ncbi:hypothetical protein [Ancylobacter defluvii]|uniref:hypothetical protein n=1 Tax=Ancylobacter defluvii TaxID=1282440 RepID=UPI001BCE9E3B|nr:hypothetical protein [Ancylobacter defluvii]MBS7587897.1 hypothetical protein [Ancylobacter defluvii]
MRGYGPYIAGAALGLVVALALSAGLGLSGTPQLLLFAVLPALGGAVAERLVAARR